MGYIQQWLGPDESVQFETRRHAFVLVGLFLKEIIILSVLIAGFILIANEPNFAWLQIALGVAALVMIGSMIIDYVRWRNEAFYVTNRRVIHTSGVLNKRVLDSSISKINDVIMEQSFLGRIFDYGTIKILTATEEIINRVDRIANPREFKKALLGAKSSLEPLPGGVIPPQPPRQSPAQLLEELAQLKAKALISDEEYNEKRREILSRM
jgi:membrane protein YdbS with pleckstrin-like domain